MTAELRDLLVARGGGPPPGGGGKAQWKAQAAPNIPPAAGKALRSTAPSAPPDPRRPKSPVPCRRTPLFAQTAPCFALATSTFAPPPPHPDQRDQRGIWTWCAVTPELEAVLCFARANEDKSRSQNFILKKNEIYNRENLVGPKIGHFGLETPRTIVKRRFEGPKV